MNSGRRKILRGTGGVAVLGMAMAAGLFRPGSAWAQAAPWNEPAFRTRKLDEVVKALGGSGATQSADIVMTSPDIALLVEKNPNMMAADFFIPDGTEPWVNTRIKMAQTSNVYALVKADGKFYYASKEVKVTLGGCGG